MSNEPNFKKRKVVFGKEKKSFGSNRKLFLEAGQRGFLATCNFKEKDCVRECYNILNEYADELYGPQQLDVKSTTSETSAAAVDGPVDIADELQKEIDACVAVGKGKDGIKSFRFHVVDTGATNCVFIKTSLSDPVELGEHIIRDVANTKVQKTRVLLRLLPIEVVCRANVQDICKAAGQLCDKYFLKEASTYSIVFNKRYNNNLKRDGVIKALAELVQSKNIQNKVDLKQASKSLVVEVIKGLCCITVLKDYFKYKKYNLYELANPSQTVATTTETREIEKEVVTSETQEDACDQVVNTCDPQKEAEKVKVEENAEDKDIGE